MSRLSAELEKELRQLYSRREPSSIHFIKRSRLEEYSRLDIVAYLFSWPDTIASSGDVDIITSGGNYLRINYFHGDISYDDLLKVIPSLDTSIDEIRPWNSAEENCQGWYWFEVRSRCWLRVHESIWDAFSMYAGKYNGYLDSLWPSIVIQSLIDSKQYPPESDDSHSKTIKSVAEELVKNGAKRYNNLLIKDLKINKEETYTRVTISIDPSIPGMISNNKGVNWELGRVNHVFTSTYAIASMLKEDEETCWLAMTMLQKPEAMIPIMCGGTLDIVQQRIEAGIPYRNPFTANSLTSKILTFERETIVNYVIGFRYGVTGRKHADELAVRMMGF